MTTTIHEKRNANKRTAGKRAAAKETAPDTQLELRWELSELPSSQHRAGLAGLVLMVRYLARQPKRAGSVCELSSVDARGATLRVNREGMRALFDAVYAASPGEKSERNQRKNKGTGEPVEPLRIEEAPRIDAKTGEPKLDKSGKPVIDKVFIYPAVIPRGAFLAEADASAEGLWIKLWRDMLWSILRGRPTQRGPFEQRAEGPVTDDADEAYDLLRSAPERAIALPSTYYLGAQQTTAECVPFKDRVRLQLLLHFWPFVAWVYAPRVLKNDGEQEFVGHVFAIPDVANLAVFCDELPEALRRRSGTKLAYLPEEAVIDVALESGLGLLARLTERLRAVVSQTGISAEWLI
jgi:CRISPR-associated protein Cmx8